MERSYNERVSAEIRAEMARQKITQNVLAQRLGWSRAALSRRVTGGTGWTVNELQAVAEQLGVTLPGLVTAS